MIERINGTIVSFLSILLFCSCGVQQLYGQSDLERRVKIQQAQVRAKIEEARQRMEYQRSQMNNRTRVGNTTPRVGNTTPHVGTTTPNVGNTTPRIGNTTPKIGNTTPRNGNAMLRNGSGSTGSNNSSWKSKHINAKTEYVFRENAKVAWLVQIDHTHTLGKSRWLGVVALSTVQPTPLRQDGSGYDYGSVDSLGILAAFNVNGKGELRRNPAGDIRLPKKLNFRPMGVSDHKMPEGGNTRLPGNMHRALGVVEAIFPEVPLFEGKGELRDISRDFWVQSTYGNTGRSAIYEVAGKGTFIESAIGNRAEAKEQLTAVDNKGNQLFAYSFHQVATFDSNRQMSTSTTSFSNSEGGVIDNVVISVKPVDYEHARKMAASLK